MALSPLDVCARFSDFKQRKVLDWREKGGIGDAGTLFTEVGIGDCGWAAV